MDVAAGFDGFLMMESEVGNGRAGRFEPSFVLDAVTEDKVDPPNRTA